jgi:hypothetical protein
MFLHIVIKAGLKTLIKQLITIDNEKKTVYDVLKDLVSGGDGDDHANGGSFVIEASPSGKFQGEETTIDASVTCQGMQAFGLAYVQAELCMDGQHSTNNNIPTTQRSALDVLMECARKYEHLPKARYCIYLFYCH